MYIQLFPAIRFKRFIIFLRKRLLRMLFKTHFKFSTRNWTWLAQLVKQVRFNDVNRDNPGLIPLDLLRKK
jgi:hypothetical protein